MDSLSPAQQSLVWLIKDTGPVHVPHYRKEQRRTVESLRKRGIVTVTLSDGGTWIVDLVN